MRLERVVIGVDFGAQSMAAAKWAVHHFLRDGDAQLLLVYAVDLPRLDASPVTGAVPDSLVEAARTGALARLDELGRALGASGVRTEVRIGAPAEELAEAARRFDADLVVVGKRGAAPGDSREDRLGGTAERLMTLAPAPVLLVTGMRDVRPRRLLVALAGADGDVRLLRWTRDLAARFDAPVVALHVGLRPLSAVLRPVAALAGHQAEHAAPEGGYHPSAPHDRVARLVSDGLAGLRATAEVVGGEASTAILDAAERHGSELIVIGRQDERRLRRALLGSVARRVLHGARCPVLVVVEPADELAEEGNGSH